MAANKLVAIHWDKAQLLIASAQGAAGKISVERTEVIDLDPENSTVSIAEHLKRLGLTRGEATVVVPRSQVEMRQLDVPPVPENELPGLVRFQAQSQFASLSDEWSLDYVPVAENGHVETVLATAMSDKAIEKIKSEIEPSGLKVKHVVIRPFSTVEMVRAGGDKNCLVINQFETEIDLTVSVNGYVNLSRSIRVTPPEDGSGDQPNYSEKIIVQETRRTIAAAMNQATPVTIDKIVLCGAKENHEALASLLKEQLQLPVEYFRPFESDKVHSASKRILPARDGRFTPLLGSLIQQYAKDNHAIDFLNPRKAITKSNVKQKLIFYGSLAAALLVAAAVFYYFMLQSKNSEIARLEQENTRLLNTNESMEDMVAEVLMVDEWTKQSVAWTEELKQVSDLFLYPDDAKAFSLIAGVQQKQSTITIRGKTLDAGVYDRLRGSLEGRPYILNLLDNENLPNEDMKYSFRLSLNRDLEGQPLFIDQIRIAESESGTKPSKSSDTPPTDDSKNAKTNDDNASNADSLRNGRVNHAG